MLLAISTHAQAACNTVAAVGCVAPPSGLVSWWPGDGNANDIADSNHGTLQNGATFAPGKVDQAFSFDGIDDFVSIPDPDNIENPTGTITVWVKTTTDYSSSSQRNDYVFGKQDLLPRISTLALLFPGSFHIPGSTGKIMFWIRDTANTNSIMIVSSSNLNDGNWHFIAVQWGLGGMKLYVDGVIDNSDPFAGWWDGNRGSFDIGRITNRTDLTFGGLVDELEIYDRALSQPKIQAIFDAGSAGKCKGITVQIDIKPGSFPNSINVGSGGNVPVAIFSTASFDATTVDPLSVTLAGADVKLKGKGTPMASTEDVNGDGLLDLVVHVSTEALELMDADTEAVLEGQTFGGIPVNGADTVRVVR